MNMSVFLLLWPMLSLVNCKAPESQKTILASDKKVVETQQLATADTSLETDTLKEAPTQLLILLKDGATLDGLAALNEVKVIKKRLTSRSQNLWSLKIAIPKDAIDSLLKKLNTSGSVKSAKLVKSPQGNIVTFENLKQQ